MRHRKDSGTGGMGAFLQIVLVGVLLFAVIWQVRGVAGPDSGRNVSGPGGGVAYVTTDEVNLRIGPGLDHEVLQVMPLHADLLVTGDARHGFLPVQVDGTSAWISADYVVPEGSVLAGTSGELAVVEEPAPTEAPATRSLAQRASAAEVALAEEIAPEPTEAPAVDPPRQTMAAESDVQADQAHVAEEEPNERWIEVDRSMATVTLHEGDTIVASYNALIGKDPSRDGYYATAVGTFYVHVKERALAETPFAPGVYLTDFVGFDPARSNGFHSPVRDENGNVVQTGGTATLGCVRLGEDEAKFLFDFAFIGMRVEVHD